MQVSFRIHFVTSPGQSLKLVVGPDTMTMEWLGGGWWGASVDLPRDVSYFYRVMRDGEAEHSELPPDRTLESSDGPITVVDRWRPSEPSRAARQSALFKNAIAARHARVDGQSTGTVSFRLLAPGIPPGFHPVIVGSDAALGAWNPDAGIVMRPEPFPWWVADVDLGAGETAYKYALRDPDGQVVRWEDGPDRILPPIEGRASVHDDEFRGLPGWRGAGVAIPVFSLRTARDVGTGQFTDLIPFADWAASIGISVIQLLPVNDTVLEHDWQDSYPYNPVSVQALHPLYVDLATIPGAGIDDEIAAARREVNHLPEIDYPRVMELKWQLLEAAYANLATDLEDDEDFADFVDREWEWLGPYSAWCTLRDRYGTPDSTEWGGDARFDPDRVAKMAVHGSPDFDNLRFHWFVQYHLHAQLTSAADYARSRGVALKGDLPIGVSPQSVEVWTRPELFHVGAQTGAPPDAFSTRGQNWQFPTYDWDHMARDAYGWWRSRFRALADYVDVFRIDHVLGFFRIWEIPPHADDGRLGYFRPSLPLSGDEVRAALGPIDLEVLLAPMTTTEAVRLRFGDHAEAVRRRFLDTDDAIVRLRPPVVDQLRIIEAFESGALAEIPHEERTRIERSLLDIAADVLLVRVGTGYQPRITWEATTAYKLLPPAVRRRFHELAIDYFHHRHADQWEIQGRTTLPAITAATDLLTCGEDLGMVPDFVPSLMNEMGLLSLEIERMPKRLGAWIADPAEAPYLSVVSPSTHDTTTLRMWWEEDRGLIERYWREALGREGEPPTQATPEVVEAIVRRQMASPAMLCVVPLSDFLATDQDLRRDELATERINDPANRHNKWRYRLEHTIDDLVAAASFNERLRAMIRDGAR